jgi:hypothetical protein
MVAPLTVSSPSIVSRAGARGQGGSSRAGGPTGPEVSARLRADQVQGQTGHRGDGGAAEQVRRAGARSGPPAGAVGDGATVFGPSAASRAAASEALRPV